MTQGKVKLPRAVAEAIEELRKIHGDSFEDSAFILADALRYGYIVDEPITVTITADMQETIRKHYRKMTLGQQEAIKLILSDVLGIKIPEVNDQ